MSSKSKKLSKGPSSYQNWKARLAGEAIRVTFEYPLFTDAWITGDSLEIGPYVLINAMAGNDGLTYPAIILRVDDHLEHKFEPDYTTESDSELYHGGYLNDEIAALTSLCLGIRLKSGWYTRLFAPDGDPKGIPASYGQRLPPSLPIPTDRMRVLPYHIGVHLLSPDLLLSQFVNLSLGNAAALIRAARLYQDAIWMAETEPELSWLMLVSAIETVADTWYSEKASAADNLRALRPEVAKLLFEAGGEELLMKVAKQITPTLGSTKKFLEFMLEFLPPPPMNRPSVHGQHSWNSSGMKDSLTKIYDYRSKALHGGRPFPLPMCRAPEIWGDNKFFSEIPPGLKMYSHESSWAVKDTPMLLHLFEYIVRGTLLNWWMKMLPME